MCTAIPRSEPSETSTSPVWTAARARNPSAWSSRSMSRAKRIGRPAYRGCPFLNLAAEFPDDNHPGRVVARRNKEGMRARLAAILGKLGAGDPHRTASQIALIINGAYVTGLMTEPAHLRSDLIDAAIKLLA